MNKQKLDLQSEELITLINYGRWDQVVRQVEEVTPEVFLHKISAPKINNGDSCETNPLRAAKKQLELEIARRNPEIADDFLVIKSIIYRMSERLRETRLLDKAPSLDRKITTSALRTPPPTSLAQGFISRATQPRQTGQAIT